MKARFHEILSDKFPELLGKKLLVAVSGGIDSMVLAELLRIENRPIGIAHGNFMLRGEEALGDEEFVRRYAEKHQLPFFAQRFDTKKFAEDFGLSIQMAARELRYEWFESIRKSEGFDYILTAHNADDQLETFFINLSRSTGIEGLTGIPMRNGHIVRPLLDFDRESIEVFAKSEGIGWREDSSNASDKYLRNKIRHQLTPIVKSIFPDSIPALSKTQDYLRETAQLAQDAAIMVYQRVARLEGETTVFNLTELQRLPNYRSYLYVWLNGFGFRAWNDIYDLIDGESGKFVVSPTHRIERNREELILSLREETQDESVLIASAETELVAPVKLSLKKVAETAAPTNNLIFADADTLQLPLELRPWREGDDFQPLGMDGKSKKVGKFLRDEKVPTSQKSRIWVLVSGGKIVWIVGHRQDHRFRIRPTTTNILRISLTA